MSYDEIKRRVSAWVVQTNYSTAETLAIEQAYRAVFGRAIRDCNCPNRHRDAVIELRIFIKNHATMEKSTYKLKAGVVIQPSGTSEVFTNDNLTDEIAEHFLKERPGARGLFAVAPEPGDAVKGPENEKEAAKVTTANPTEQEPAAEGDKEQDNAAPEAEKPSGLNPEILSAIKARLAGGDPKSAIIKDYAGMVVDGKSLTEYAVKKYITAASAE